METEIVIPIRKTNNETRLIEKIRSDFIGLKTKYRIAL